MCLYTHHLELQILQDEAVSKCRLMLFEDPALKAQPRHEVAASVGRNLLVQHDTVGPNARFAVGFPGP